MSFDYLFREQTKLVSGYRLFVNTYNANKSILSIKKEKR